MKRLLKKILGYFKKQFTAEKLLDKYSDRLFEILMNKAEDAINKSQKGKLVATDINVGHHLNKSLKHVFTIIITVDKQQLIELLKRR